MVWQRQSSCAAVPLPCLRVLLSCLALQLDTDEFYTITDVLCYLTVVLLVAKLSAYNMCNLASMLHALVAKLYEPEPRRLC